MYTSSAMIHHLDAGQVHYEWNNAIPPRLDDRAGRHGGLRDARRGRSALLPHLDPRRRAGARSVQRPPAHRAGAVRGARPGDALVVEILEVKPAPTSAGRRSGPAAGSCPRRTSRSRSCRSGISPTAPSRACGSGVAVPLEPFPGVMGVALDEPGGHSTMPPRKNGGNMDIKQLTAGATLFLPVWVDGRAVQRGRRPRRPGRRRGVRHRGGDERPRARALRSRAAAGGLAEPQLRTTRPPPASRARAVVRHHRARPRSLRGLPAGGALHDRPPGARARALAARRPTSSAASRSISRSARSWTRPTGSSRLSCPRVCSSPDLTPL